MVQHIEIANAAGVNLDDVDHLLKGSATGNVVKRLGVSIDDVEQFIRTGSVTARMCSRLGVTPLSAGDELGRALNKEGRIGLIYGLLLQ